MTRIGPLEFSPPAVPKVEAINQLTRSIITLSMTAAVIYGFVVSRTISAEVFVAIASGVITWWFSRDQSSATTREAAALIHTPAPTNGANGKANGNDKRESST